MRIPAVFLLLLSMPSVCAFSQCITTVHQNSISITSTQQLVGSAKKYWVCDAKTLILTGNRNDIWVEDDGILTLSGDSNNVFGRKNSTLTIAGAFNIVKYDASATLQDNGTNTTLNSCNPMSFDYSVAPASGCQHWIGVEDIIRAENTTAYPQPASDVVNILHRGNASDKVDVSVYDAGGRLVGSFPLAASGEAVSLDVTRYPNGIYTVQIENGNTLNTVRIAVQH